ncbi:MAG TPA: LysR family transcriptional regulator [Coleofasciculaceae cyanobacterium]
MDDLNAVIVFLKVAELGGFVAAARSLNLPKSTVSLKINELEQRLGTRLLHRTTRRVSLTEEGRLYYENCLPMLDALHDANDAIASLQGQPQGLLRVIAPVIFVQSFLSPNLPEFLRTYPELRVMLHATDERKGLIKEGFDVAIRVGHLEDSTLVMKPLSVGRLKLFASPAYLKERGEPMAIADLKAHTLLSIAPNQNELTWTLQTDQQEIETVRFRPRLLSNNITPIHQAIVSGLGIGLIPEFLAQSDLKRQELINVLPQWSSAPSPINVVYPSRKYVPQKVSVFLDFLDQKMKRR